MLNRLSQHHIDTITLWYLVQHSLSSFYKIAQHFENLADALQPKHIQLWQSLGIHKNHIERLKQLHSTESQKHLQQLLQHIQQDCDFIVTPTDQYYPTQLQSFNDKPPILFGQGNIQALLQPQIAIVGSRKASPYGRQITHDFAYYLSHKGFYITSGLAQGIDETAHYAALKNHRTIAVMGTGLEQTYPTQNIRLRHDILNHHGAVISEFLPLTKPLQHHFPRRNRIVSGLSLGVLVTEASLNSGSLITAKLAAEQGLSVFAIPGHIYSEAQAGCHLLIREGAILVDHPEQIVEDLALPTQWQQHNIDTSLPHQNHDIPEHLLPLYHQLDWVGQSMEQLTLQLKADIKVLTSDLVELELLGLCMQQSGLYLRCRSNE
jgi:DNA processing protein